jgi:hypothetical protein
MIASGSGSCDWLEREGYLLVVDGAGEKPWAAAEAHLAGCRACQACRQSYARLIEQLKAAEPGSDARSGWQAEVLARLPAGPPSPGRRRPVLWAVAASTVAAACALVILIRRPVPAPWSQRAEVEIISDGSRHYRSARAEGRPSSRIAAPGDRLSIRVADGQYAVVELRVFRGGQVVFRCAGQEPCRRQGGQLSALVPLALAGRYQPLLVWSGGPLPEPAAGITEDAARLLEAGARVQVLDAVTVR